MIKVEVLDRHGELGGGGGRGSPPCPTAAPPEKTHRRAGSPTPQIEFKDSELGFLVLNVRVGHPRQCAQESLLTSRYAKAHGTLELGWDWVPSVALERGLMKASDDDLY